MLSPMRLGCYFLLALIVAMMAITTATPVSADNQERAQSKDEKEKKFDPSNFHMGFGKRFDPSNFHMGFGKRFDPSNFHMGFGKRFDPSNFHMGFGKRFDPSNFHMGFGKRRPFDPINYPLGLGRRSSEEDDNENGKLVNDRKK